VLKTKLGLQVPGCAQLAANGACCLTSFKSHNC